MMTAEQLKNSILQLAIQGRLVDQRSIDGNARTLVEELVKLKNDLLREDIIKPIKGIEPINEVPFEIPDNWTWVRLGTIASFISDGTHRTPKYVEKGVPFLSVQNISQGYFDMTKIKYISLEEHNELAKRCKPENGDILVCRIGTLGKAIKVTVDFEFSIFVSLGLIRLLDSRLADYIICVINSGYGKKWIDEVKVGGGTHTNKINLKSFPDFLIPLPPIKEQIRILKKLEEFDSLLSEYATASTKLNTLNASFPEMMKKSILQEAMQGKLVPQDPNDEPASVLLKKIAEEKKRLIKEGKIKKQKPLPEITEDEIPFEIPENWEWVRLNNCLDVRDGTHDSPKYHTSGHPLVTSKNLKEGRIDFSTCKLISEEDYNLINQRSQVDDKDILFAMIGTVGNPVLFRGTADFAIKNMALFKHIGDHISMEYVQWYLFFAQYDMKKQASGGVQSFVSLNYLRNYLIPIPPIEEQKRIVNVIEQEMQLVNALNGVE